MPAGGQVEPVAVGPPARGDEQQVAADDRAVGQVEHDLGAVAADPHGLGAQVHVPAVAGQRGEPLGHRLVLAAQHRGAAPDHRHRAAERGEHVRELGGDVARAEDHQPLGQGVDPHDRVRGVERHARLRDDPRARSAGCPPRSRCGRRSASRRGPRCAARRGPGEPGVALVEGDVPAAVGAVVAARRAEIGSIRPNTRSRMSVQRTLSIVASIPRWPARATARATSAGCTNILVGMQPTLRQVPPNVPCSTSATSRCSNRASRNELPEPEPMTIRS